MVKSPNATVTDWLAISYGGSTTGAQSQTVQFSFGGARVRNVSFRITDVDRAGDYEPWHGVQHQDVRIIRDIYPPRMTLQVRHFDASGALVSEGERKLSDMAFLIGPTPLNDSDPLRYEKRMIDSWLRRELDTASR